MLFIGRNLNLLFNGLQHVICTDWQMLAPFMLATCFQCVVIMHCVGFNVLPTHINTLSCVKISKFLDGYQWLGERRKLPQNGS